jgi:hypothetical protein
VKVLKKEPVLMRLPTLFNLASCNLAFLCVSMSAFGQAKPPTPSAKVDRALRDRVAQFMQFTIDRAFSKAYMLVAKDDQDYYLSSNKPQYKAFKIQKIDYSKNLKQATVMTQVTRVLSMQGRELQSEIVVSDLWKMVDGKWVWYHDPDVIETPLGPIRITHTPPSAGSSIPTNTGPDEVISASHNLRGEATVDKKEVVFVQGAASSDEVVVHNGFPGPIELESDIVGDYGSFFVEPAHSEVPADKDVVLKVSYKPLDRSLVTNLRVRVEPFNRTLMIPLRTMVPASAAASSVPSR